ncbi:ATP-dependent Clp protease ATP-binding subunit [candidate division WWE3 bacterium]|nr:ATP-dependent Clp protease ATP-binding subunit [candidate division WWE3 bacterium]
MTIERLTDRAKSVIQSVISDKTNNISESNLPKAKGVMDLLLKVGGVGSLIIKNNPELKFNQAMSIKIGDLVEKAYFFSAKFNHLYVGTEHLLLALLDLTSSPNLEHIKKQLQKINIFPNTPVLNENETNTPFMEAFGVNLNKKIVQNKSLLPVHRSELNSLIAVLLKKESSNALIVGEVGVGRKTLVELLVHKINSLDTPSALAGYQIVEFDAMAFIANVSAREGFESAITALLEDLDKMGDIILYIKDLQTLFVGTSGGIAVPFVFSMLRSYLLESGISIIGVLSTDFYTRLETENSNFLDGFDIIKLTEPTESETIAILRAKLASLSQYHSINISDQLLKYTFDKAKNGIKNTNFPQKAISLLDHACAMLLIKKDIIPATYKTLIDKKAFLTEELNTSMEAGDFVKGHSNKKKLLSIENSLKSFRDKIKVEKKFNLTTLEIDEAMEDLGFNDFLFDSKADLKQLSGLSAKIKQKIIGQGIAVDTVARALIRSKLGLRSKKRPLGNFLFLGPTGVGKTELAKVLSESVFNENGLIRLDMSDFGEKHTVARLVGAPPGYVGYGEGGELTSKIEENPNSVVLFDEIEKAHPDVLNILLQIMEEGELSDAKGNRFDFSKSVVILTSNIGSELIFKKDIGFIEGVASENRVEDRLKDNLKKIMKPELINRFDEVIIFKKLGAQDQKQILDLLLAEIDTTLKKQNVHIKLSQSAKRNLLKTGYSNEYGARGLRRTLEVELLDSIAEFLLKTPARPLKLKMDLNKKGKIIPTT